MKTLTLAEMVKKYNELTGKNIKKFRDRATAEAKLAEVLPKETKSGGKRGRKSSIPDTAKIKLLVEENPKRGESAKEFELYFNCKTVGEFISAGGRRASILWDMRKNHIAVNV